MSLGWALQKEFFQPPPNTHTINGSIWRFGFPKLAVPFLHGNGLYRPPNSPNFPAARAWGGGIRPPAPPPPRYVRYVFSGCIRASTSDTLDTYRTSRTLAPAACNRSTTCCSEPQPAQVLLPTASAGGAGPDFTGASGVSPGV